MNIKLLFFTCLILSSVAQAETVYKTVDDEGNVVFSDSKTEGAEAIQIREAQTVDRPDLKSFEYRPKEKVKETLSYKKLAIETPKNGSTVHGGEGNVNVSVTLEPELKEKDSLVLYMDGKQMLSGQALQFLLPNVDRGTHTIEVAVITESNDKLIRSSKVTFYVRRIAELAPELRADPDVVTPLNPPRAPKFDVSPTNPPKPDIPKPSAADSGA